MCSVHSRGEGNLHPHRSTREYLNEYTSRGKPKIPPADRIFMDFGHKARKNLSDNTDLVFQAIGPALHIMQLRLVDEASWFHLGRQRQQLRSSALALCYSAAGYCAPVWSCSAMCSAHTSQIDVQLNSTMRLISGTLRSTSLPWLPVLSNIEPPALRRKLVEKIVKHDSWPPSR